jgi:hypothetical protein
MFAKPQKEHEWLQQLVGTWSYESEGSCEPGKEPQKFSGTEIVKSLGGLWIVSDGTGEMPDGTVGNMMMTLGYDPAKKMYIGTWIGSMMTHMWIYEGELDATGKILPLNTIGQDFSTEGKMAKYQDIIEVVSKDHRILRSQSQGEDGKWTQFMKADYRRTA